MILKCSLMGGANAVRSQQSGAPPNKVVWIILQICSCQPMFFAPGYLDLETPPMPVFTTLRMKPVPMFLMLAEVALALLELEVLSCDCLRK